jgi:hypothetical protein
MADSPRNEKNEQGYYQDFHKKHSAMRRDGEELRDIVDVCYFSFSSHLSTKRASLGIERNTTCWFNLIASRHLLIFIFCRR